MTERGAPDERTLTESAPAQGEGPAPGAPPAAAGPYVIDGELGRGGLGRVLRAHDARLGRPVALKQLLRPDAAAAERFEREARLTARLQHPGIVPVYEAGNLPTGERYYAMRLVSGQTLRDAVAERPTLVERLSLLPNVIAVAEAVAYAHEHGIVHRDLKPSNVVVGAHGETVVIDWGLAIELGAEPPPEDGGGDRVLGTPAYMPPEQAAGRGVDERADVYALGAILYHLLAGGAPYGGRDRADTIAQVLAGPPAPLAARAPGVPRDLAAIAARALARDPAARYRTAGELADDLRRFQTGRLVLAHEYSRAALLGRWLARHRAVLAVAAVMLAALAATAVVSVRRILREKRRAETRAAQLILVQARSEVPRDPTASLAWLKAYPPGAPGWPEAQRVASRAAGFGVARHVFAAAAGRSRPVAMSPAGTHAAIAGPDGTVRLLDLARGEVTVLSGHVGQAWHVGFSPDGTIVTSAGDDGKVRLFSLDGEPIRVLDHGPRAVIAIWSAGGQLATGGFDGSVERWDVATWTRRPLPTGWKAFVGWMQYSADGRRLLATGLDGLAVWDLPSGTRRDLDGTGDFRHAAFSPDAAKIAAGGADGTVRVIDVETGAARAFTGHEHEVTHVDWSPDGAWIVSAGGDGTVRLWDPATGDGRVLGRGAGTVNAVSFSPDGQEVLSAGPGEAAHLWEVSTGDAWPLLGHDERVMDAQFSPRGEWILSVAQDGSVRVWDRPELAERVLAPAASDLLGFVWPAPGGRLIAASADGGLQVWELPGGVLRAAAGPTAARLAVAAANGRTVASAIEDGSLSIWDSETLAVRRVEGTAAAVPALAVSRDGAAVASAARDGSVALWGRDGAAPGTLRGSGAISLALAFSPDGAQLATAGDQGIVSVWERASGQERRLEGARGMIWVCAFAPGGALLATGGDGGEVLLWDLAGGGPPRRLAGAEFTVQHLAFAPSGRYLAAAGMTSTPVVWDLEGGGITMLPGHQERVTAMAFSPDGAILATASQDATVRVYELATGALRVLRHPAPVRHVEFSPDGELLATAAGRVVRLWAARRPGVPADPAALRRWLAATTTSEIVTGDRAVTPW